MRLSAVKTVLILVFCALTNAASKKHQHACTRQIVVEAWFSWSGTDIRCPFDANVLYKKGDCYCKGREKTTFHLNRLCIPITKPWEPPRRCYSCRCLAPSQFEVLEEAISLEENVEKAKKGIKAMENNGISQQTDSFQQAQTELATAQKALAESLAKFQEKTAKEFTKGGDYERAVKAKQEKAKQLELAGKPEEAKKSILEAAALTVKIKEKEAKQFEKEQEYAEAAKATEEQAKALKLLGKNTQAEKTNSKAKELRTKAQTTSN